MPNCIWSVIHSVVAVNFNQLQYRFKEGMKLAQIVLTINKQQNVTFALPVKITPVSATGESNGIMHTLNISLLLTSR